MKTIRPRGFSLIELMIGMTLGLFVVGGVIAMFLTSSHTASNQQRLSQVLENGRYGAQLLADELRHAGNQYCSSFGAMLPTALGVNPLRTPLVQASAAFQPVWMRVPTEPRLDPRRYVRGYECTGATCTPALPTAAQDVNVVPPVGVSLGQRVAGADVLTIRYLASDGQSIGTALEPAVAGVAPIPLSSNPAGAPLDFVDGQLGLIANCETAELVAVSPQGLTLRHGVAEGNAGGGALQAYSRSMDARVFNFSRDFLSVTYFVGLRADTQAPGQLVSSLFRIENGGAPEELIEGVERFDVTYAVLDGANSMHYLDAAAVNGNGLALPCPPVDFAEAAPPGDCLWRGVQGFDVSMLVASTRTGPRGDEAYQYSPDGPGVFSLAANAILPSGLPAGNRLRREFRVYAGLRNVNR